MSREEWLAGLKAGDAVVVRAENRAPHMVRKEPGKVSRTTRTLIFVEGWRAKFRRATGEESPRARGWDARASIWPPGEA